MRRRALVPLIACLALPAAAHARATFTIKGAGFGHGIGMSQYGADGFAQHGYDYKRIVDHYYTDTSIAEVSPEPTVRVLLQSSGAPSFTGGTSASGRRLDPGKTYSVARAGGNRVALRSPSGRTLKTFDGTLRVTGDGPLRLNGTAGNGVHNGRYRGALEFRAGLFSGVSAINALGVEDYVRGVVSAESPSSWPAAALQAQAVVARSYAITTDAGSAGDGYTAYPDTRSQVYRGVAAEVPSTDSAVKTTKGQVVTYAGKPVVTYFFSTSGGKTENVENSFVGALPRPWLKGVDDPFDSVSPRHRWGPYRMSLRQAGAKLGSLVKGRFKRIKVVDRGYSPRIVKAYVVGSRGRTAVTGATLRARFGLYDSWAFFRSVSSKAKSVQAPKTTSESGEADPSSGGTAPASAAVAGRTVLRGRIAPAARGEWLRVQRRAGSDWVTFGWTKTGANGRYRARLGAPGAYRVLFKGAAGPVVRAR